MLTVWMRIVGVIYLVKFFVMVIIQAPDILGTKLFVEEMMIGVEWGVLGATLIAFSRVPERAAALIWVILVLELLWSMYDINMVSEGFETVWFAVWMAIHAAILVSGIFAVRNAKTA